MLDGAQRGVAELCRFFSLRVSKRQRLNDMEEEERGKQTYPGKIGRVVGSGEGAAGESDVRSAQAGNVSTPAKSLSYAALGQFPNKLFRP